MIPGMTRVVDRAGGTTLALDALAVRARRALVAAGLDVAVADGATGGRLATLLGAGAPDGVDLTGPPGPDAAVDRAERALAAAGTRAGVALLPDGEVTWVAVVTPEAWRPSGHRVGSDGEAACRAALEDVLAALS
jgi:hypothetical protein